MSVYARAHDPARTVPADLAACLRLRKRVVLDQARSLAQINEIHATGLARFRLPHDFLIRWRM